MADTQDYQRSAYVWNTAGSMLNAFQSVIMLMVLTRVCDMATAGVFTTACATIRRPTCAPRTAFAPTAARA